MVFFLLNVGQTSLRFICKFHRLLHPQNSLSRLPHEASGSGRVANLQEFPPTVSAIQHLRDYLEGWRRLECSEAPGRLLAGLPQGLGVLSLQVNKRRGRAIQDVQFVIISLSVYGGLFCVIFSSMCWTEVCLHKVVTFSTRVGRPDPLGVGDTHPDIAKSDELLLDPWRHICVRSLLTWVQKATQYFLMTTLLQRPSGPMVQLAPLGRQKCGIVPPSYAGELTLESI